MQPRHRPFVVEGTSNVAVWAFMGEGEGEGGWGKGKGGRGEGPFPTSTLGHLAGFLCRGYCTDSVTYTAWEGGADLLA